MSLRYTKAQLEEIVYMQLENLNAMHDLLHIMKVQNDLIHNTNKGLQQALEKFKSRQHPTGVTKETQA